MPEFIERDVRSLRDSSSLEQITLLVGYDGKRDELAGIVSELGGCTHDRIGRTTLRISMRVS